jgi:hypothetical protein
MLVWVIGNEWPVSAPYRSKERDVAEDRIPPPGVAVRVDGQCTVEGHRMASAVILTPGGSRP